MADEESAPQAERVQNPETMKTFLKVSKRLLKDIEQQDDRPEGTKYANDLVAAAHSMNQDINVVLDKETGETILHHAAKCGRREVCRVLITNGANADAVMVDASGQEKTPAAVASNQLTARAIEEAKQQWAGGPMSTPRLMEQAASARGRSKPTKEPPVPDSGSGDVAHLASKVNALQETVKKQNEMHVEMLASKVKMEEDVAGLKRESTEKLDQISDMLKQIQQKHIEEDCNAQVLNQENCVNDTGAKEEPGPRACQECLIM